MTWTDFVAGAIVSAIFLGLGSMAVDALDQELENRRAQNIENVKAHQSLTESQRTQGE